MSEPDYIGDAAVQHRLAQHLAAAPTIQEFLGVASDADPAAAALELITESDGEVKRTRHIMLESVITRLRRTPGGDWRGTLTQGILIYAPPVDGDSAAAEYRRAVGFRAIVRRVVGTFAPKAQAEIDDSEGVQFLDESDGLPGWSESRLMLTLNGTMP